MKKQYKIIWIDDEYDKQGAFIHSAKLSGFEMIPFKASREGMDYLRASLHTVDAIILDAKVFKDNTNELASTRGLRSSLDEISKISGQNNRLEIPHVIFTGQPDLFGRQEFEDMVDGVEIFSKFQSNELIIFIKKYGECNALLLR